MDLSKIMTISGRSGLFRMIAQTKGGAIVESLTDSKRFPVFTGDKISSLEEISIFTTGEDLPLKEVLKKIHEKEAAAPSIDPKSDNHELIAYFEGILPDFDKERVYPSDIRKVISWYNLLLSKEMLDFTEEKEETRTGEETGEQSGEPTETGEQSDDESNP